MLRKWDWRSWIELIVMEAKSYEAYATMSTSSPDISMIQAKLENFLIRSWRNLKPLFHRFLNHLDRTPKATVMKFQRRTTCWSPDSHQWQGATIDGYFAYTFPLMQGSNSPSRHDPDINGCPTRVSPLLQASMAQSISLKALMWILRCWCDKYQPYFS